TYHVAPLTDASYGDYLWQPQPSLFAWSNTLQLVRPGAYGPSLLAFLRLENYTASQGGELRARLEIWNVGNAPAEDVKICMMWDVLWYPPWFSYYLSPHPGPEEYERPPEAVVERLGPGESVELEFNLTAKVPGVVVAHAIAVTARGDCCYSNSATAMVVPEPGVQPGLPYIVVEKLVLADEVEEGDTFTITLRVSNVGTAEAEDVLIVDELPEGLSPAGEVRISPPGKEFSDLSEPGKVMVRISSLAPGEVVELSYDVRAEEAGTYILKPAEGGCMYYGMVSVSISDPAMVVVEPKGAGGEAPGGGPGEQPEVPGVGLGLPEELAALTILVAAGVAAGVVGALYVRRKH
ncbi:hypothetical protein DRO33_02025, partial [Candidatus Bathyarchaeota archaeon]